MTLSLLGSLNRIIRLPRLYLYCSGLILLAGIALSLAEVTFVSPWLRVIVGLLVFLLPGGYLFALVPARDSWDIIDFVGYGFAFSVAFITLLGLITRTLSWSIDIVELVWYLLAIAGFVAVLYKTRRQPPLNLQVRAPIVALFTIILIQLALFAHSSLFAAPTTNDQFRELALVNGFLRDEPLGWTEPFYETGNLIADRDFLTYWVLAQALVVDISDVPILLTRYLVNPFVVIVSVAGMYIFARNLGHRPKNALVYMILGLLGYSLVAEATYQVGGQFFVLPMLDKVMASFALAPVAISSAYLFNATGNRRALFGFVLSFLATVCVHPVQGGFVAGVIVIWCCIRLVTERGSRLKAIQFGLVTLALISPAILLRVNTIDKNIHEFDSSFVGTDNKILVFDSKNPFDNGNPFIAINFPAAGYLTYMLLALTLFAVAACGLSARGKLLLAFVIAIGIGLLPYTAWIYGRLVAYNNLQRVLWLLPYGYMMGFLIESGLVLLGRIVPRARRIICELRTDRVLLLLLALALIVTAYSLQFHHKVDYSRDIYVAPNGEREWLEVAAYIDEHHDDRVWIAASPAFREDVIGLSWKAISLSRYTTARMSYNSNISVEQATTQFDDNSSLFDAAVSVAEKFAIIDRHGIDYMLFSKEYSWMIDALYQADKERLELVYSGDSLRLIRLH